MAKAIDRQEEIYFIPEDQQEDEDDLRGGIDFRDAVVMSVDWTVDTIYQQIKKGNIQLDPVFQRRGAWDDVRKSRLIESIIVGMPIPNIVLAESRQGKGRFIVIDGKQRLLSIKEFFDGELALKGLDIKLELNGRSFSDLDRDDRNYFENSTIRSTLVRNWSDDKFLYAIFYRLNSGSLPLSPQELRRALVGGHLLDEIEEYITASDPFQAVFGVGLDRRMRDSELVLRFIAFDMALPKYDGDLKRFLDDIVSMCEEDWKASKSSVERSLSRLDRALVCARKVFAGDAFKKYGDSGYERRMNRAVFDVVARTFSDDDVAEWCESHAEDVVELFVTVCGFSEFKESVEKTTKSKRATHTRMVLWGERLASAMGKSFDKDEYRIV